MRNAAITTAAGQAAGQIRSIAAATRASTMRRRKWTLELQSRSLIPVLLIGSTIQPFKDPEFSRRQADKIYALIAQRTKDLPPRDFVEMMRSAIREDEWMLYAHGAIMGFGGGLLHLALFGVGGP